MKTYRNEHVTVVVECSVHLLKQTWVGLPTSTNFQNGSQVTFLLARRHQIKRWLIDLQQLRLFNPTDLQWFLQQWLPKASLYLPSDVRVAIVLNDLNQFGKLGADLLLRASTSQNSALSSRYFVAGEDARQWLMENS